MVALSRAMRNSDTAEIRRLNVFMNGPRVIWGRMPSLTLSLFILFTDRFETYGKESAPIPGAISWIADNLVNQTIWMCFPKEVNDWNFRSATTFWEIVGKSWWIFIVSIRLDSWTYILLAKYLSRANGGVAAHRWFEGGMDDVGADSSLGTRENDLEEDRY